MLDPISLALPMVQTLSAFGCHGSLQLTSQTGLTMDFSFQFGSPNGGSTPAHCTPPTGSATTPPTGSLSSPPLPPAPNLDGLGALISSLQQLGGALASCGKTVVSAVSGVANTWTGMASAQAAKHVALIAENAQQLSTEHAKLSESTAEAATIVADAAAEIAAVIAKFIGEAATALTHSNPITTVLELIALAANATSQCISIYMKAHGQLQVPTGKAMETIEGSMHASLDVNGKPLPLPTLKAGLQLASGGHALASTIFRAPSFDMGATMHNGMLTGGHIAWGDGVDKVNANPAASTHAASATGMVATAPNSAEVIGAAKNPTGMTTAPTNTPLPPDTGTSHPRASYVPPTGGANVTASQIGAQTSTRTLAHPASSRTVTTEQTYVTQGTPAATNPAATSVAPAGTSSGVSYAPTHSSVTPVGHTIGASVDADELYGGEVSAELEIALPDGSITHAPNQIAARAIRSALTQLGVPYVWGGTTPGVGLDCSGLTQWAYEQAGLEIGRTTWDQDNNPQVDPTMALPGDLIMWDGHVAMFLGNGLMIEAGDPVSITPVRTENAGMAFEGVFRPWLGVVE